MLVSIGAEVESALEAPSATGANSTNHSGANMK